MCQRFANEYVIYQQKHQSSVQVASKLNSQRLLNLIEPHVFLTVSFLCYDSEVYFPLDAKKSVV